ncbi:MAG: zinc-dependent peptidase [Verrucomicrobiota bacterium]|nr:zinc-dependent peptidase [Verrucomicrobiota bacterium]
MIWTAPRRRRLRCAVFPRTWRQILATRCAFYHRLAEPDRRELEGHIQVFLAEKQFEGCGGLVLGDEIRVCVAAYACLLLLHRKTDYYPSLRTVLVYPSAFVVPTLRHVGSGVLEESHQLRAGESWREGAVVLAWDAACGALHAPDNGYNVIVHEFAHQLDYEDGRTDGAPLLGHGESRQAQKRRYADWSRVMRAEFEQLQTRVQRGESSILQEYGATNPAEFFAVATECFFGKPLEMREKHPNLYDQLKWYFQQDPACWFPGLQPG